MTTTLREAAAEFLDHRRIAVAGVSREGKLPANLIYRRLRENGYQVFAINPNAETVEGDPCYADVRSLPRAVDGVVVATTPEVAEQVVEECAAAGVDRVWLHRGLGPGSLSEDAVQYCHEHGVSVIPGGCPCMFGKTSDRGHRCMRAVLSATGKIPKRV